jgi:hypothetical protein
MRLKQSTAGTTSCTSAFTASKRRTLLKDVWLWRRDISLQAYASSRIVV